MYPPPRNKTSSAPPFSFLPQRAPFRPPTLSRDESSGSTFLADLATVHIPPVSFTNSYIRYGCDCCRADLTNRPRVHCLECPDFDICSECHHFGRTAGRGHHPSHAQQTLKPRDYPFVFRVVEPDTATYRCDCCRKNLSAEPRARCVTCKNYDLCLDCNLAGETSLKHRFSHNVNIITSHLDEEGGVVLMGSDLKPTSLLEKIVDSIFDYVDTSFEPQKTQLFEPVKLSAFYSFIGVEPEFNLGRKSNDALCRTYSAMRCEHHLVSDNVGEIAARPKPWVMDGLDTTPRSPALTRAGWSRFFIMMCWDEPDLMHFVLSNSLSTGKVIHKGKGEPYRLSVPRESLPRRGAKRRSV